MKTSGGRYVPWAALRVAWTAQDWGGAFFDIMIAVLPPEAEREWVWPHMLVVGGILQFAEPIRRGTYNNCLNVHS